MRNMDKAPSVPYLDANGWKHACRIRKFEFRVKRIDKKKKKKLYDSKYEKTMKEIVHTISITCFMCCEFLNCSLVNLPL